MPRHRQLIAVEDYAPLIGGEAVARIREKAEPLKEFHVAHVNSTHYGGGVAKTLDSLTLLISSLGIKTGWRTIQGAPDFFSIIDPVYQHALATHFKIGSFLPSAMPQAWVPHKWHYCCRTINKVYDQ